MFVIYKAEFPNGKVYIGKSKNFESRKYHHIWNSKRNNHKHIMMSKAINKYGPDSIKWSIICECLSSDDMNNKEIEFIKLYNSTSHEFGYNMVCGDKFLYEKRDNFDESYKIDIIKKKLKSNGYDPDKYVIITDELKNDIINDYVNNKLSRNALVKKYSISKQRMSRLLKSENIEIDMNKASEINTKTFSIDYIDKIVELYNSGLNIKTIGQQENLTIMMVSRILHDSGTRISIRFKDGKRYDARKKK